MSVGRPASWTTHVLLNDRIADIGGHLTGHVLADVRFPDIRGDMGQGAGRRSTMRMGRALSYDVSGAGNSLAAIAANASANGKTFGRRTTIRRTD